MLVPGSGLTSRRAIALIRNLPFDSATSASFRGGADHRGWDTQMYMLANIVDSVKENTHAFVSAHSKRRPPPPKPIDRPDGATKKNKNNLFAAMARTAYMSAEKRKAEE